MRQIYIFPFTIIAVILAAGIAGWQKVNVVAATQKPSLPPAHNAFDQYVAAASMIRDNDKLQFASLTTHPPDWDIPPSPDDHAYTPSQKKALLAENSALLAKVHAAAGMPFQLHALRGQGYYQRGYKLTDFLRDASALQAQTGDWNGAMSTDLDTMQLAADTSRNPGIDGMSIGVSYCWRGLTPSFQAVDHLTRPQTVAALARLTRIEEKESTYPEAILSEKAEQQAFLTAIFAKPLWRTYIKDVYLQGAAVTQGVVNVLRTADPKLPKTVPSGWKPAYDADLRVMSKREIMANTTSYMDALLANAQRPYSDQSPVHLTRSDPYTALMFNIYGSSPDRFVYTLSRTGNRMLVATLALHAYKLDHGRYPATLADLSPAYLASAPNDPFAVAGPLHYRRAGASYVLYSVGPDGKDDGGKPISRAATWNGSRRTYYDVEPDSKGDIVVGLNIH